MHFSLSVILFSSATVRSLTRCAAFETLENFIQYPDDYFRHGASTAIVAKELGKPNKQSKVLSRSRFTYNIPRACVIGSGATLQGVITLVCL